MVAVTSDVTISAGAATLAGTLPLPSGASGVVAFAHGRGSSRLSPRNREVAAALVAAAARPDVVAAVVSRGGRPDLARAALPEVRAPTLLVVGALDTPVIGMNRDAAARMQAAAVEIVIVPGATHLFEEPGTMDAVIAHASRWFRRWLVPRDA